MIEYASADMAEELVRFLIMINGRDNAELAQEYVSCCFSQDYRRPAFVVCKLNDNIVGAAAYSQEFFTTGTWGISWVCVDAQYRNTGIGGSLVEFCLNEISRLIESEAFVILGTYPNKTRLYDKLGFEEVYKDNKHGSFMIRKIKPL